MSELRLHLRIITSHITALSAFADQTEAASWFSSFSVLESKIRLPWSYKPLTETHMQHYQTE